MFLRQREEAVRASIASAAEEDKHRRRQDEVRSALLREEGMQCQNESVIGMQRVQRAEEADESYTFIRQKDAAVMASICQWGGGRGAPAKQTRVKVCVKRVCICPMASAAANLSPPSRWLACVLVPSVHAR